MSTQPKILICDDDAQTVRTLARAARAAGWIPITEVSASRVWALALKHRPDVIVLDIHQELDGLALMNALHSDPRTSGARVVMISGSDWPSLASECLAIGADAFLHKPFEFHELLPPVEFELEWTAPVVPRCTLLIADDSPQMVASLVRAARREGFDTVTDTTSANVLELARLHQPGVIVLDLHQTIDGRDLLTALKADPLTKDIKVVMLSGEEDQLSRHDCFKLGAEDYFVKPLDPLFFRRLQTIAGLDGAH